MNTVYDLPDSYAKPVNGKESETATNTYRLFQIGASQVQSAITDMNNLLDDLNLSACSSESLNRIGAMYHVQRNGATDRVYRSKILFQLSTLFSDLNQDTILERIADALQVDFGSIFLSDMEQSAMVQLHGVSVDRLKTLGGTSTELRDLIQSMLPCGVGLVAENFPGTFQYCDVGEEQSTALNGTGFDESGSLGLACGSDFE